MTLPTPTNTGREIDARSFPLPETIRIPAGRLEFRDSGGESRSLEVASFRLGRTPVTNAEYAPLVVSHRVSPPPWWSHPDFCASRQPVVGVSWEDAMTYCSSLSEMTGSLWRLPTEAEWEFAVCGGLVAPRTAWGETIPPGEIPEGPLRGPWETGRGTPNGYGLLDVGTIVHEWCLNWHEPDRLPSADQRGARRRRASRGGSWRHEIRWSSPSARSSLLPDSRYSDYGFRVLRELDTPPGKL